MTRPQDPLSSTYRAHVPTCFPKAIREPSGLPLLDLVKSGEGNRDLVLYTAFLGQTYQLQRRDILSNIRCYVLHLVTFVVLIPILSLRLSLCPGVMPRGLGTWQTGTHSSFFTRHSACMLPCSQVLVLDLQPVP